MAKMLQIILNFTRQKDTLVFSIGLVIFDATVKSPKNVAKTTPTLQNQVGKILLTLASFLILFNGDI